MNAGGAWAAAHRDFQNHENRPRRWKSESSSPAPTGRAGGPAEGLRRAPVSPHSCLPCPGGKLFSAATSSRGDAALGVLPLPAGAARRARRRGEPQPELPLAGFGRVLGGPRCRLALHVGAGDPRRGLLLPLDTPGPGHGGGGRTAALLCACPSPSGPLRSPPLGAVAPRVPRTPPPTRNYWRNKTLCVGHKSPTGLQRNVVWVFCLFVFLKCGFP